MLKLSSQLRDLVVMSLRTGGKVGKALEPIINPNNLRIVGWYCDDHFSSNMLVLQPQDVRDFVPQGLAVDDHDALADPEDLVRLQEIMDLKFELIGKQVVTNHRRKVGKVTDYAADDKSLIITKLYVARPIYRSLSAGQLTIDRKQILEITDRRIIVKDVDMQVGAKEPKAATAIAAS